MDYATGYVGYKRRISYQSLSETVHYMPDRGTHEPAMVLSKKAARCAVDELERAGLVQRIPAERSLVLFLPLADTDESLQKRRGTPGAQEGHTPQGHSKNPDSQGMQTNEGHYEGHTPSPDEGHPSGSGNPGITPPNGGESTAGPPPCPHQQIIDIWHEVLPELPRVLRWQGKRKDHLQARWREDKRHQSVEFWRGLFEFIRESPWLMGQVDGRGGRPFKLTLEWVVNPTNFTNIIERKYHDG